jgi:hypothetical protein
MGLGQGNRAVPPSRVQLSAVLVNVYKQLNLGSMITDPITVEIIHTMGALFVDDTNLYTWLEDTLNPGEVWSQLSWSWSTGAVCSTRPGEHSNHRNASGTSSIMNVWTTNGSMWTWYLKSW